ncbi:MAG TPA: type IV pilus assembly protein PilM [Verrucomicrobiae bacterium]|nr:type IV pilus assembly protein PilM [Verrucomicrobiae bacterium]
MLNLKSFLAVDFGAGSLKLAEFEVNEAGGLRLKQYGIRPLGPEGAQESTREATILKALQAAIVELGVKSRDINVCAPGFHVFSKFVKLPPVETSKVTQIIQYEAQQNVPFPLQEVVWDYQILGTTAGGELEVLLVAIKAEIVEGLFRVSEAAKLRLQVADVSPAALCNAFRYNYGDIEDCTMLLDIGAKTSNLLFFEKGKVFSRSINLGANSITTDFASESKLKFDAAEKLKIEEGFVSLGGAYEEPENPHQAAISKIARQFMTRLHIQVNQTMQFYRGQQGGSAPQRLFLSGGASVMPYTAQFFAEKLNVPVEYFNPLRNVQIDPAVNLEDLARVAHSLGEVVGLGLRNLAHCPVELNLIPESTRRLQGFNEKKPYFIATVFSLVAVVAMVGLLYQKLAGVKQEELAKVTPILQPMQMKEAQFNQAYGDLQATTNELQQLGNWMTGRYYWADLLTEVRRVLIKSEQLSQQKLRADTGIWIEQMLTTVPSMPAFDPNMGMSPVYGQPGGYTTPYGMSERDRMIAMERGIGTPPPVEGEGGLAAGDPNAAPLPQVASITTNEISVVKIVCRAVDLSSVVSDANTTIIYTLENELKASPMLDPKTTQIIGAIAPDEATRTFTVTFLLSLKNPLKL